jgi:hypothetical protein
MREWTYLTTRAPSVNMKYVQRLHMVVHAATLATAALRYASVEAGFTTYTVNSCDRMGRRQLLEESQVTSYSMKTARLASQYLVQ